jgi:hypothetical protein
VDATHARFGSLLEWLVAAACILGVLAIGSVLVREFRTVAAVAPVIAHEDTVPDPPAAVPAGSVAVPVVLLSDGVQLHVGDSAADLAPRVAKIRESAPASIERLRGGSAPGERVTRFYEVEGRRFAVVLAPQAGEEQVRIVALYVQQ